MSLFTTSPIPRITERRAIPDLYFPPLLYLLNQLKGAGVIPYDRCQVCGETALLLDTGWYCQRNHTYAQPQP